MPGVGLQFHVCLAKRYAAGGDQRDVTSFAQTQSRLIRRLHVDFPAAFAAQVVGITYGNVHFGQRRRLNRFDSVIIQPIIQATNIQHQRLAQTAQRWTVQDEGLIAVDHATDATHVRLAARPGVGSVVNGADDRQLGSIGLGANSQSAVTAARQSDRLVA